MGTSTLVTPHKASSETLWPGLPEARRPVRYPPGCVVFRQGDNPDELHLVVQGAVKLVRSDAAGRDAIAALRLQGCLLELAAVVLDVPHAATAITMGWCELRPVSVRAFNEERERNRALAAAVQRALAADILRQIARVGGLRLDARRRLEQLIADLADSCGRQFVDGRVRLDFPLTQSDVAELLLISREHVNHVLAEMSEDGWMLDARGWLRVPGR